VKEQETEFLNKHSEQFLNPLVVWRATCYIAYTMNCLFDVNRRVCVKERLGGIKGSFKHFYILLTVEL
jgi:hypothetical protein